MHKLREEQLAEWNEKVHDILTQELQVAVAGPEVLQPGTENDFQIQTRNLQNAAQAARLSARLVDQNDKVVYEVKEVPSDGNYRLRLPADLPLTANRRFALDVVAHRDGKLDHKVHHTLPLASTTFITHIATDKPMYRPGETVHFRSLTVERFSMKPVQESLHLQYSITSPQGAEVFQLAGNALLKGVDGKLLKGPDGKPLSGIGAGEFVLPPTLVGGEYTLTVREANQLFGEQQRKFIVNQFENPRLNKELDFTRKSYGPGQEVLAACTATRAEGGPMSNKPVTAEMFIDGKPYGPDGKEGRKPLQLQTDAMGKVNVRFKLPEIIERGQATLSIQFNDGGNVETLVRPIPIALKKLFVEFFPEGGDLVAGTPNRVYFQARTTLGKPAELKGRIVDDKGHAVAQGVATLHDDHKPGVNQGLGLFSFTPAKDRTYELKIDEPAGMEGTYRLPAVRPEGIVLTVPLEGIMGPMGHIGLISPMNLNRFQVQTTSIGKDRNLLVGLYCRGLLLDQQSVTAQKDQPLAVQLKPGAAIGGVLRVTVFEEMPAGAPAPLVARAERLVYRAPTNTLVLTAKPNQERYVPRDQVTLNVKATNEKQETTPAVALVAVVDKSVITLADEKTFKSMLTHLFLGTEIRKPEELEFADFLVGADPQAPAALDTLLGTQGWRRFAEQNPQEFRAKQKEDGARLLAAMGQNSAAAPIDLAPRDALLLLQKYATRAGNLVAEQQKSVQTIDDLANHTHPLDRELIETEQQIQRTMAASSEVWEARERSWATLWEARAWLLPPCVLIAMCLVFIGLAGGLAKGWQRGRPYIALAGGGSALFVLCVFWGQMKGPAMVCLAPGLVGDEQARIPLTQLEVSRMAELGGAEPLEGVRNARQQCRGRLSSFDAGQLDDLAKQLAADRQPPLGGGGFGGGIAGGQGFVGSPGQSRI